MSQPVKKAIISVCKQPDVATGTIDVYCIAFLFVEFSSTAGGIYGAISDHTVHIPKALTDPVPDLVNHSVYNTSASMYETLFKDRTPLQTPEMAGHVRGQIISLLVANGIMTPSTTKFIGLEAFSDLNLLIKNRYLLHGDFSEDSIDIRSSFETLMEAKYDVGRNKQELLVSVMEKGVIPSMKVNPKETSDPLYECYQCLKIYNGMLKYGRMPLK